MHDDVLFYESDGPVGHLRLPKTKVAEVLFSVDILIVLWERLCKGLIDELVDAFEPIARLFEVHREHLALGERLS